MRPANAGFSFWYKMDIHTAAKYMEHGYRIRRNSWPELSYMTSNYSGMLVQGHLIEHSKIDGGKVINYNRMVMIGQLELEDLLADDWELILEGIMGHFPITYSD